MAIKRPKNPTRIKCSKCGKMTSDFRGRICSKCAFPNKKKK